MNGRSRKGLTLIEVLVAIAVIGTVFVVLASAQITNLRITSAARADSELLQVAVQGFERIRTVVLSDFSQFNRSCVASPTVTPPTPWGCAGTLDDPQLDYTIRGAEAVGIPGVIEVALVAERRGETLTFRQLVSCLDAVETPTLSDTSECE